MTQEEIANQIFVTEDDIYSLLRIMMKAIAWDGRVSGWRIIRCGFRTIQALFKMRRYVRLSWDGDIYIKEGKDAAH